MSQRQAGELTIEDIEGLALFCLKAAGQDAFIAAAQRNEAGRTLTIIDGEFDLAVFAETFLKRSANLLAE